MRPTNIFFAPVISFIPCPMHETNLGSKQNCYLLHNLRLHTVGNSKLYKVYSSFLIFISFFCAIKWCFHDESWRGRFKLELIDINRLTLKSNAIDWSLLSNFEAILNILLVIHATFDHTNVRFCSLGSFPGYLVPVIW